MADTRVTVNFKGSVIHATRADIANALAPSILHALRRMRWDRDHDTARERELMDIRAKFTALKRRVIEQGNNACRGYAN